MILELAPDAPALVRAAAGTALALHVAGGAMGIAAGWTAVVAKKGGRLHALAGTTFLVSMLTMAGIGAIVAPMLPTAQWTNTTAAVFTLYIVLSGWMTARRPAGEVGRFERAMVVVPLVIATMALALLIAPAGNGDRASFGGVYAFGLLSALAATCDLLMISAGGLSGPARRARHLWRMCVALAIAAASFFVGQPDHVPEFLKTTHLNLVPVLGVVAVLVVQMFKVRVRWRQARPKTALA